MDHLDEAEKALEQAEHFSPQSPEILVLQQAAMAHALIEIGNALRTLADCVTVNGLFHVAEHREEG